MGDIWSECARKTDYKSEGYSNVKNAIFENMHVHYNMHTEYWISIFYCTIKIIMYQMASYFVMLLILLSARDRAANPGGGLGGIHPPQYLTTIPPNNFIQHPPQYFTFIPPPTTPISHQIDDQSLNTSIFRIAKIASRPPKLLKIFRGFAPGHLLIFVNLLQLLIWNHFTSISIFR